MLVSLYSIKIMKNSFWGFIWQSFLEIYVVPATFLGIIVSVLAWIISAKTQISLALVITIAVFTLIVIITLFHAASKAFKQTKQLESELQEARKSNQNLVDETNRFRIPKILRVQKNQSTGVLECLLEKSNLFPSDIIIGFYCTDDDGFERLIGGGYIGDIQTDGKIKAVIERPDPVYQDILDRLANNEQKILDRTIVKAGLSRKFLQP